MRRDAQPREWRQARQPRGQPSSPTGADCSNSACREQAARDPRRGKRSCGITAAAASLSRHFPFPVVPANSQTMQPRYNAAVNRDG